MLSLILWLLLKVEFNSWSSFTLSWVDKVTIWNKFCINYCKCCCSIGFTNDMICWTSYIKSHFTVYWRYFKSLQILLKYFNGTATCTFAVPALRALFVIFDLNLNDSESFVLSFGSSLQHCHKLPLLFA